MSIKRETRPAPIPQGYIQETLNKGDLSPKSRWIFQHINDYLLRQGSDAPSVDFDQFGTFLVRVGRSFGMSLHNFWSRLLLNKDPLEHKLSLEEQANQPDKKLVLTSKDGRAEEIPVNSIKGTDCLVPEYRLLWRSGALMPGNWPEREWRDLSLALREERDWEKVRVPSNLPYLVRLDLPPSELERAQKVVGVTYPFIPFPQYEVPFATAQDKDFVRKVKQAGAGVLVKREEETATIRDVLVLDPQTLEPLPRRIFIPRETYLFRPEVVFI